MSETGFATAGDAPVTRSLAGVLRDLFSGTDDAVRLILATTVAANTGRGNAPYACVAVAGGPTLVIPTCINVGDSSGNTSGGLAVFCLATRTTLLLIGRPINQGN